MCSSDLSGIQSGDYYVFDIANYLEVPGNMRHAPGTGFKRFTPRISDDNFACKDYGLEQPVPDEVRAKYSSALSADVSAVRQITDFIKLGHEIRVHTLVTDPANVPNAGIGVKWDDPASNPKADVDAAKEAIRMATGSRPNTMVLSRPVMNVLESHKTIAELFKYTQPGLNNEAKLAQYFGIPNLKVAEQIIAQNQEGQAISAADIWGDDILLCLVQPGQDLMQVNFGRTFYWNQFGSIGEDAVPIAIESYREDQTRSDVHRALHSVDEKLTCKEAGYLLTDALQA